MILLIDNYDSFSYNLYQLIGSINRDIKVIRNDDMTVSEIEELDPSHIVISPGPGKPKDAGICEDAIRYFADKKPILGVCLGHQAICEAFGGVVDHAKRMMHGKSSVVRINNDSGIFRGMDEEVKVARYHSLSAVERYLPACLKITGRSDDDEIMAVEHREYPVYGLQFHPESILTSDGSIMLKNFLSI
ncbi:MAG: aminodeoxychorismate/anthranilate synthase component II [Lachnospiraceae bacterium]|nr:aminodeoxychorismate/anthranilate synthase component II [Lachnospiraceae bacterium]MBR5766620.1 aminodeoxychorismate/anthranilate synthase component II [Lachnospiraceae bacterium]MBR6470083.1 aminodeoxychorismate/anthranilate synthase component II [Lachnospiraceae bacterium]